MIKYFVLGLVIGGIVGYTVAALMNIAGGENE